MLPGLRVDIHMYLLGTLNTYLFINSLVHKIRSLHVYFIVNIRANVFRCPEILINVKQWYHQLDNVLQVKLEE